MLRQSSRGFPRTLLALGLVLVLLTPSVALAQVPPKPSPTPPTDQVPDTGVDPNNPPDTGPPPPDLIPSDSHFSGTDERDPTQLCNKVMNIGYDPNVVTGPRSTNAYALPTAAFNVEVTVEENVSNAWVLISDARTRLNSGPGGGQGTQLCWNYTLEAGTYRAIVFVDSDHEIAEANAKTNASSNPAEDNNVRTTRFLVQPKPRPDLTVSALDVQPRNARPGQTQLFTITVANRGNAASGLTWAELRDENGLFARVRLGPLDPLQSTRVVALTHPDDRAPGVWTARAVLDPDNLVDESNESNNEMITTYSIAPHPQPDLVLQNVALSGTLIERHGLRIEGDIKNVGNATSTNSTVRLYLDDTPARNWTSPYALKPNQTGHYQFYFLLTPGNHTLTVRADPDNAVAELDETNNDWTQTIEIAQLPANQTLANLVIDRLDAGPLDPAPNEVVNVTGLVHNVGLKRSENTTVDLYIGAKRLASIHVGPANPDVSVSFHYAWAAPPIGPYELRATVDPDNLVNETDETDNNYTIDFDIAPPRVATAPDAANATPSDNATDGQPGNGTTPPTGSDGQGPVTIEPSSTNQTAKIDIPQVEVTTRAIPGGVKGYIKASLRNPSIEPLGRITVTFRVDGNEVKTKLIQTLAGAETTAITSDEIDMPPGAHTVSVEAKLAGVASQPVIASKAYTATAGEKKLFSVPGFDASLVLGVALAAAALVGGARRKRS